MNSSHVHGITGLFDGILSPVPQALPDCRTATRPRNTSGSRKAPCASTRPSPVAVRRGRPPGKAAVVGLKEKVTLRLTGSLMAFYREWTWEARCQLSQLVEQASVITAAEHDSRRSPMAENNKPVYRLRYGNVVAAVWTRNTHAGYFYDTTFRRVYKDGEKCGDSTSFEDRDLPNLAKAAADVHSWIHQRKANAMTVNGTMPRST